jgi:EAL domain-containing protein (putative c-di-GMP-specific phosphodiesterase class I)/GGDEF domain-containing protein
MKELSMNAIFFLCSTIVFLMLILIMIRKHSFKEAKNIAFIALLLVGTFSSIIGIFHAEYLSHPSEYGSEYAIYTLYLIAHSFLPFLLNIYVYQITGRNYRKKYSLRPLTLTIWYIPISLAFLLLIINLFTPVVFTFGSDGTIIKKFGYYLLAFNSAFYAIWAVIYLIMFRRSLKLGEFISISAIYITSIVMNIIAVVLKTTNTLDQFVFACLCIPIQYFSEDVEGLSDPMTKLFNQIAFKKDAALLIKENTAFRMIIIKVSNFDNISKILYSRELDELTISLANRLLECNLRNTSVYHYQKGVYVINSYMENEKKDKSRTILDEISKSMSDDFIINGVPITLKMEIIYLHLPGEVKTMDEVSKIIEYPSVHPYEKLSLLEDEIVKSIQRVNDVTKIVSTGIRENRFMMYYQPIYDAETGKIGSTEALVRLKDAKLGFISPEEFIPIAEQNGDILKLGQMIFEMVCKDIHEKDFFHYGLDKIGINLSKRQFVQTDLADFIQSCTRKYDIDPKRITLEITESLVNDVDFDHMPTIKKLEDMGFTFSMDDYGTGYSNFRALTGPFHFKVIKIDKSILWASDESEEGMTLLRSNAQLIHNMNFTMLCEGVETESQKDRLLSLGCRYFQGYLYSKPLPVEDYVKYLSDFNHIK